MTKDKCSINKSPRKAAHNEKRFLGCDEAVAHISQRWNLWLQLSYNLLLKCWANISVKVFCKSHFPSYLPVTSSLIPSFLFLLRNISSSFLSLLSSLFSLASLYIILIEYKYVLSSVHGNGGCFWLFDQLREYRTVPHSGETWDTCAK